MPHPSRPPKPPSPILRLFPGCAALPDNPIYLRLSGRRGARRRLPEFKRPKSDRLDFSLGRFPFVLVAALGFAARGTGYLLPIAALVAYAHSVWGPWERKTLRFLANAAAEPWGAELALTTLPPSAFGRGLFSALWEREAAALARLFAVVAAISIPYWAWVFWAGWDPATSGPGESLGSKLLSLAGCGIVGLGFALELLQAAAFNLTLALRRDPDAEFGIGVERVVSNVAMGTLLFVGLRLPGILAIAAWTFAEVAMRRPLPSPDLAFNEALALLLFNAANWPATILILGEFQRASADDFGAAFAARVREGR